MKHDRIIAMLYDLFPGFFLFPMSVLSSQIWNKFHVLPIALYLSALVPRINKKTQSNYFEFKSFFNWMGKLFFWQLGIWLSSF